MARGLPESGHGYPANGMEVMETCVACGFVTPFRVGCVLRRAKSWLAQSWRFFYKFQESDSVGVRASKPSSCSAA